MNSELENKRLPFEVPENYFEDFAARMDARLAEEMQKTQPKVEVKGRKIDFRRLAALVASSAAVFAGLLFGGVALMNMQQQVDNQAAEIIAQETYVDEMLEMMDIHHKIQTSGGILWVNMNLSLPATLVWKLY